MEIKVVRKEDKEIQNQQHKHENQQHKHDTGKKGMFESIKEARRKQKIASSKAYKDQGALEKC